MDADRRLQDRDELLEKVAKHIEEEPRRLRMNDWIIKYQFDLTHPDKPPCGTAGCIAGWACILSGSEVTRPYAVEDEAKAILNLKRSEADSLFFLGNWPLRFRNAYHLAGRTRQAETAAARIRHFINTGE